MTSVQVLSEPLELPCGAVMPNRLVKAPMEQVLGKFLGGKPNAELLRLYAAWAAARWGMIITGNVGVDRRYIGLMFDIVFPDPGKAAQQAAYREAFVRWARVCKGQAADDATEAVPASAGTRPLAIVQIVHCGRQSTRGAGRPPWVPAVAPSAVPMRTDGKQTLSDKLLFGTPKALTTDEVHDVIARFVRGAVFCAETGFDGIELHAAHGYLLSSFLSPLTNQRTDAYGGSAENRFRIVREIVEQTRERVPKSFAIGVKLNSSDYVQGGLTEEDALQNVRWLAESGQVDFVEVSGGTYEKPAMFAEADAPKQSARSHRREGFFASFAKRVHQVLPAGSKMRIIVTGGFRSRAGMAQAVRDDAIDGIGLGRPAALNPALPVQVLDAQIPDEDERASAPDWKVPPPPACMPKIPLVGAGWGSLWHSAQLHRTAYGERTAPDISLLHFLRGLKVFRD
ncbi:hypothetical protein MBRA1_001363 [Malassezia brasiliensis]|uniref:NADH:flavin oxidoreductase/NADH oxidase N-terminal domain-containing protein n=1 Tax=Malassezia brasiliensis TaxID=1821822 RepID=A0AAF0DS59_9BASI|nr:hypothetical protein MBRA1_001363 [Malassezia brasiliensis]